MSGRKEGYKPAGEERETLADLWTAPTAETTRKMLAILRGGGR